MKKIIPLLLFLLFANVVFGQFGEQIDISKNTAQPVSVVSTDLDNDNDLDVVVISRGDSKVSWYENLGGVSFGSQKIIDTGVFGLTSLCVDDIDNDGNKDIIIASSIENKIGWYKNTGAGVFDTLKIIANTVSAIASIYVIDLDNDNDLDIVSGAYYGGDEVSWYENQGGGIFSVEQIISTNHNLIKNVLSSDLDNDGDNDILVTSYYDDKIAWYENLGSGLFSSQKVISILSGADGICSLDIDNDGDNDVVAHGGGYDDLIWHENLGGGIFSSQKMIDANLPSGKSIKAADMNNDGNIDIVVGGSLVQWYENLGTSTFNPRQVLNYNYVSSDDNIYLVDFSNDGDIDVLFCDHYDNEVGVIENLGSGVFSSVNLISSGNPWRLTSLDSGDIDNDGDIDFLSISSDTLHHWYENLGNFTFKLRDVQTNGIAYGNYPYTNFLIDYNGDNMLDIVSYVYNAGSYYLVWNKNLGNGNFDTLQFISNSLGNYSQNLAFLSDIDNDTDLDLIVAPNSTTISFFENLGGNNFSTAQTITNNVSSITHFISVDINNDGNIDIVSASGNDDKIAWYENLGNGSFGSQQIISTNANWALNVKSADLDNDGDIDIVSASGNDNKIAWYENLGNGSFGTEQIISINLSNNISFCLDDINNDGLVDVISVFSSEDKIAWNQNLGGGIFGPQQTINNPDTDGNQNNGVDGDVNSPLSLIVNDFDNDGDIDIISASRGDDKISCYSNEYISNYQLKGRLFYDVNQNAKLDSNELGLSFIKTQLYPKELANFTDNAGNYFFSINDTSSYYTVSYLSDSLWNLTTDSVSYIRFLTSTNPIVDSLDFGFYPDTIIDKINTEIIGSFPRCNDTINYWLDVKNNGTTIPSGVIHLQLDDSISYVGASIIPDSINGQNLYWHYDSLFYFSNTQINLQVLMPDFNSIGDSLTSYLNVSVIDSSENQVFLASDTLNPILVCAYDPNDKITDPAGIDSLGYISANTEYLEYTVRFQNTGNDTAITVNILDQLDTNLVWNTLIPLASSHPLQIDVDQTGEVIFKFENILLPDSNSDFLGSQGFVKYKINLKPNLAPGTSIFNTAYIYFDQNPAVITNTKINTIYNCTGFIQNTISNLNVCQNDTVSGVASDDLSTTAFTWSISNVHSSTGSNFTWLADTSGVFNLILSATNSACSKDTTIVLNVNAPFLSNQNVSICQGDSMLIYGNYQSITGTYYDSLQTINGCDSVLSTTLSVNPVYLSNTNDTICQGDSVLIYGNYQSIAGTYYDSLQTVNGCDSVHTTTLFLNANFNTSQNQEICQGDSIMLGGSFQTNGGVYYDSLQTINGCDSVLSTTLIVNPLPNVTLTNFNPDTICSTSNAVTLQNGSPSGGVYSGTGVSGGTFDPNIAGVGTHSVIYTYTDINSCINSDSTFITVEQCVGMDDLANDLGILIYPNPNTGLFTIEKSSELDKEIRVNLLDATSRVINHKLIPKGQQKIEMDITNYSKGVYYLQLTVGKEVYVKQILKN